MQDYAVPCPGCAFVLRFHDPALFGRKARCPQCHAKFVLTEPANRQAENPAVTGSARRAPEHSSASVVVIESPAPARSAAPATSSNGALSSGLSCGFRPIQPPSRRQWTLPDPLRMSHAAVIALGAAIGAVTAPLWLSEPSALMSCLSAVAGGLLAAGILSRRLR